MKINIEDKTVVVTHKTRCVDTPKALKGEENPCKTFNTTFDFSNCTDEEMLELASKTCIISFRTKSKVNSITEEAFSKLQTDSIDVHEAIKAERRGLSNAQKAEKAFASLSEAEVKALLAKLMEVSK